MLLKDLREAVCEANLELDRRGIILYTWGNVSGIDREKGLVVIKPSGVDYDALTPENMVVVDLENKVVEGDFNPSTDTRTHTRLYKAFPSIGGVTHSHSRMAVAWAQARKEIPCFGTTHADHCLGLVPCTEQLSAAQVGRDYEGETGAQIVARMAKADPVAQPMILVAGHGPFTWGATPDESVKNAVVLEEIAAMASATVALKPDAQPLEDFVLAYHYERKHGANSWYGQKS